MFTDDALAQAAELAIQLKTGARGLRTIIEGVLLDVMYEVPSRGDVRKCVIDAAIIREQKPALLCAGLPVEWEEDSLTPSPSGCGEKRYVLYSGTPRIYWRFAPLFNVPACLSPIVTIVAILAFTQHPARQGAQTTPTTPASLGAGVNLDLAPVYQYYPHRPVSLRSRHALADGRLGCRWSQQRAP